MISTLLACKAASEIEVYLVDTDVISDIRKGDRSNSGVRAFFAAVVRDSVAVYLSAVTIGELRQGVERIRHRGDGHQAKQLERWLKQVSSTYADCILPFDEDISHVWGCLCVPHADNPLDKQIAATALLHDLAVVTRYTAHFEPTGVRLHNPFTD